MQYVDSLGGVRVIAYRLLSVVPHQSNYPSLLYNWSLAQRTLATRLHPCILVNVVKFELLLKTATSRYAKSVLLR